MAELADAPDLGSGGEIRRGSSPLPGTATIIGEAENDTSCQEEGQYNPDCCGKTLLRKRVQWRHLRRNRHSNIGTYLWPRLSSAFIQGNVLPEISFSEAVRFAEDEARFRIC